MKKFAAILALAFMVGACSEKKETTTLSSQETSATREADTSIPVTAVVITGNDNMKFDKTEFTVKVNQEVSIELKNVGVMEKEVMGHNLVILNQGVDVEAFAKAAEAEVATEYIPASLADNIFAHTKLLGPGESETIKVTFTESGDYTYLCTFPNHHLYMKGIIHVVE
ncbi:plastocyanin/azurin family copper-binding protein [Vaginella massiliensis]|uniref:plastocyanin/azurin family copper-binding protein n=1 Tax=Vaginella massiliensis TaxID=1816680 RepID=UPI0008393879|nr:plastocyanin/azurin family copper-binding protein [Vaginella massiliensis]